MTIEVFHNRFLALQTPDLTRMLLRNTKLTPDGLAAIYPDFNQYRVYRPLNGLLYLRETPLRIQRDPKIILQIMGGSAAGKNTVMNLLRTQLTSHSIDHKTILTATTRQRGIHRIPPEPKDAHIWLERDEFKRQKIAGQFIETIHQGFEWYGTGKKELEDALESNSSIIFWEAEIYGSPFMKEYLEERAKEGKPRIPIVTIYLLNGESIRDYAKRIWRYRSYEFWWRFPKSMAEVKHAVKEEVDGFLLNKPTNDPKLTEVIDTLMRYLNEKVENV